MLCRYVGAVCIWPNHVMWTKMLSYVNCTYTLFSWGKPQKLSFSHSEKEIRLRFLTRITYPSTTWLVDYNLNEAQLVKIKPGPSSLSVNKSLSWWSCAGVLYRADLVISHRTTTITCARESPHESCSKSGTCRIGSAPSMSFKGA